jgi:osmotically-inducible protein OsmY
MKKLLITFLLGLIAGSSGYWAFRDGPLASKLREQPAVARAVGAIEEKVLERSAAEMKAQMERDGQISMSKPRVPAPIADDLLNDLIKAKLAADPLTTKAGIRAKTEEARVELSGKASSYEQVARAVRLVMECEAVSAVVAKIEVKAP